MSEKACEDGRVLECGDYAECAECGTSIRWDLRDDTFWGFQKCERKERNDEADQAETGAREYYQSRHGFSCSVCYWRRGAPRHRGARGYYHSKEKSLRFAGSSYAHGVLGVPL